MKGVLTTELIEARDPLASSARRAGWRGCNILLEKIPHSARIGLVQNGQPIEPAHIARQLSKVAFLRGIGSMSSKGWLVTVMRAVEKIGKPEFLLSDLYAHEAEFRRHYPANRNVRAKIRQQLQLLRNQGFLTFLGNGRYQIGEID